MNAFLTVHNLVLNTSFTIEMWVKNYKPQYFESGLFATLKQISDATNINSMIRFGIYDEKLIFKDLENDIIEISKEKSVREK